jgi:acetyl-CoA carboxylase biotin carboxylase subunit
MLRALREIEVKPIKTTAPLHVRILSHPRFRQGSVNTKFIESTIFGTGKTDESESVKEKK